MATARPSPAPALTVGILAFPGCMTSEVLGIADVIRVGMRVADATTPDAASGLVDVHLMTARPSLLLDVMTGAQLRVGPVRECDVLVVPGFDVAADEGEIDRLLDRLRPEQELIGSRLEAGTQIVSVCVGAFLLAEAGILDDRQATTSWLHAPLLRARHPRVRVTDDLLVVRDRGVTTAAAFSAMYDLTLHLLRDVLGQRTADATASVMLLDASRERQSPYVDERLLSPAGSSFGASVQRWLSSRLEEPFDLAATAAQFAVSPRTLSRRFADDTGTTPLKYVHQQRMRRAKHLLGSTRQPVGEVARKVGYQDAATFSQLFKRQVGLAPRDYRARFASPAGERR